MRYPITLTPAEEGGFVVSFPDIPEALTQGDSREEALEMGLDALVTAFEFYFEDNRPIPQPSEIEAGAEFVEVPLSVAAKVLLLNAFLDARITQLELAKRIGKPKQEIQRLFDLHHATKIDSLQAAAKALGKTLSISIL